MIEIFDVVERSYLFQLVFILLIIAFMIIFIKAIASGIFQSYFDARILYEKKSRETQKKEYNEESLKQELKAELDLNVKSRNDRRTDGI